MNWSYILKSFALLSLILLTAACGGGGGGGTDNAPTATAVSITDNNGGSILVGDTLTGTYTYNDAEGDAEDTSTFRWLRNASAISGATSTSYVLVSADSGQNITFEVTPLALTGTSPGTAVTSSAVAPGTPLTSIYSNAISFPTPKANMGATSTKTITGKITRNDANPVAASDVSSVSVNGTFATLNVTDPSRWTVQISTTPGSNSVAITTLYSDNTSDNIAYTLENDSFIQDAIEILIDTVNNRGIITGVGIIDINPGAISTGELNAIDLASGAITTFSDANTGTGPGLTTPRESILDVANNRLLVIDSGNSSGIGLAVPPALFAVDLSTGNRTIISNNSNGSGTNFITPRALALDSTNNLAYVVDSDVDALFSIDLATGNRTIVSSSGFTFPQSIVLESGRALIADGAIISVNLSNGSRSVFSDVNGGTGAGPDFVTPRDIQLDGSRILVIDRGQNALVAVDLATGNRSIVSNSATGTGSDFQTLDGMTFDGTNDRSLVVDKGDIIAVDTSGNRTTFAVTHVGTGPAFSRPEELALDSANNRIFVVDILAISIVAIDIDTGNRTTFSDASTGNGTNFVTPRAVAIDSANNRLLVIDSMLNANEGALYAVDMNTGDRTIISDNATASGGTFFNKPLGVSLDSTNNIAYVTDIAQDALYSVDLNTGIRTIVSSNNAGLGTTFIYPQVSVVDNVNSRVLVLDSSLRALVSVDTTPGPSFGDRSIVSQQSTGAGSGPALVVPSGLALDGTRVLIVDEGLDAVLSIDLASGDRTVLSDTNTGNGTNAIFYTGMVFDSATNRIYATDRLLYATHVIDLGSGDRAILSKGH